MPTDLAARARDAAQRAGERAGIVVREVHELDDLAAVRRLFDTVWAADPTNPVATVELLRAFAHTGQYVVLAEDLTRPGRPVVAASLGFLAAPAGGALHSNVTGVLPVGRGRSIGLALKLHQRAWALARGLAEITWTFDPLIRRNAWFNLAKLGAGVREYLVDFYGPMSDGVNAGDVSDRLSLSWSLTCENVAAAAEGRSLAVDLVALRTAGAVEWLTVGQGGGPCLPAGGAQGGIALVQVPPDIEGLRATDPGAARAWRSALREVLGGAMADGWVVRGVGPEGFYVLVPDSKEDR